MSSITSTHSNMSARRVSKSPDARASNDDDNHSHIGDDNNNMDVDDDAEMNDNNNDDDEVDAELEIATGIKVDLEQYAFDRQFNVSLKVVDQIIDDPNCGFEEDSTIYRLVKLLVKLDEEDGSLQRKESAINRLLNVFELVMEDPDGDQEEFQLKETTIDNVNAAVKSIQSHLKQFVTNQYALYYEDYSQQKIDKLTPVLAEKKEKMNQIDEVINDNGGRKNNPSSMKIVEDYTEKKSALQKEIDDVQDQINNVNLQKNSDNAKEYAQKASTLVNSLCMMKLFDNDVTEDDDSSKEED